VCQKAGRPDQAQAALGRARAALALHQRRPDPPAIASNWHDWTQDEILVREAEGLIPTAPVPAPTAPASLAREQTERRERRARADLATTRAALALIGLELGQKEEALAELKDVLAERERIAAEEPSSADYLADLAATRTLLAQALVTPRFIEILPTAQQQGQAWRYTTQKPEGGWMRPDFDDSTWKQGKGGFGTAGNPWVRAGTTWRTSDIWIRRAVDLPPAIDPDRLRFRVYHDEDCELAVNGVPAARRSGYVTKYETTELEPDALTFLKPGSRIVLAAHCRNTVGGAGGVDIGLSLAVLDPGAPGDAAEALRAAATVWARIDPADPRQNRIRQDSNAVYLEIVSLLRTHTLTEAATGALRDAGDILTRGTATDQAASAADWLMRCVAQGLRGDTDDARAACRKGAGLLKPPALDPAVARLVRMAVRTVGPECREAQELLAAAGQPRPD
jgi:hypothetical protein